MLKIGPNAKPLYFILVKIFSFALLLVPLEKHTICLYRD
ncbi:hypothetical protein SD77_4397 [Bacillus badius]|uniref:Uncharacterized protein n=1 Tax=Bacillus badius TaxID=1455 RepID=A0ABR5AVD2_BACBA|nr:hypothetical protein SD78_0701 [Bacillus badius]KIL78717.1 hypothetical protein SD77_4397 [Bacillus badius]